LRVATPAGLEPAACRLEGGCSIQLSYGAGYACTQSWIFPTRNNLIEIVAYRIFLCLISSGQWVHCPIRVDLKLSA
jgi:hypothetical protein